MPLVYGPIGALHYPWYNFQYKNLDHVTYFHQWEFIHSVTDRFGRLWGDCQVMPQLTKYIMYIFALRILA